MIDEHQQQYISVYYSETECNKLMIKHGYTYTVYNVDVILIWTKVTLDPSPAKSVHQPRRPMQEPNTTKTLIEPSIAELFKAVTASSEVTVERRRHWSCSLRVITAALGKPPELLPARW